MACTTMEERLDRPKQRTKGWSASFPEAAQACSTYHEFRLINDPMSAFHPIPFADLIRRIFYEYRQHGKILGIPKEKFFVGFDLGNLSVPHMEKMASTPMGPAAGPHTQLAQNLVMAWLTGSRILELKTIQALDTLDVPRPCIDTENIGFNVEWSQELTLEQSLREYVKAWMLIEMIKQAELLGEDVSRRFGETIFDLSIGYDLKGISSERIHSYIQGLRDAQPAIDKLRREIPQEYAEFRDLDYDPQIVDSVTLSTFHGCPADEIEQIISHLVSEHEINVIVKLNPTLLGIERVSHLLHEVLGYHEVTLSPEAFEHDLKFDQAIDITRRMFETLRSHGKCLGLKFTNTLVVKNHKGFFTDDVMYMSGPPLHVLALHLLKQVRQELGTLSPLIPMSFSAGIDGKNFADAVSLNLVPVTVCTDMLKVPGYVKGTAYLHNLIENIQNAGAINIADYILKYDNYEVGAINDVFNTLDNEVEDLGQTLPEQQRQAIIQEQRSLFQHLKERVVSALKENDDSLELLTTDALIITEALQSYEQHFETSLVLPRTFNDLHRRIIAAAAARNLDSVLEHSLHDSRYTFARNSKVPKKLPSELLPYDCTSCGRCVAICPNNANFMYHVTPATTSYVNLQLTENGVQEIEGGDFILDKFVQFANFADCCNECGLCGIHCVEQGKPYQVKPKYFGSRDYWASQSQSDGFFVEKTQYVASILGRIQGQEYYLQLDSAANQTTFRDGVLEVVCSYPDHQVIATTVLQPERLGHILDMQIFHVLLTQLHGVLNLENCNYINVKYV